MSIYSPIAVFAFQENHVNTLQEQIVHKTFAKCLYMTKKITQRGILTLYFYNLTSETRTKFQGANKSYACQLLP